MAVSRKADTGVNKTEAEISEVFQINIKRKDDHSLYVYVSV